MKNISNLNLLTLIDIMYIIIFTGSQSRFIADSIVTKEVSYD